MARLQPNGSILMADGRVLWADDSLALLTVEDFKELDELFEPAIESINYAGGAGGTGGFGGGGGRGSRGPQGAVGAAGASGAAGFQGNQGPAGGGGGGAWLVGGNALTSDEFFGSTTGFNVEMGADGSVIARLLTTGDLQLASGATFLPEDAGDQDIGSTALPFAFVYSEAFRAQEVGEISFRAQLDSQNLLFQDGAGTPLHSFQVGGPGNTTLSLNDTVTLDINATTTSTNDLTVNGKLTVTGAIDPTSLSLSGSTALFIDSEDGSTAPISAAGHARIRYNHGALQWEQSINGGPYTAFGGGASFPLLAPDGSAAAPSYSFTNGTNYGMYFDSGATQLAIAAGGLDAIRFNGNPQALFADGSAANPSLSFISDPSTGVFLGGPGVAISHGGSLVATFNNTPQISMAGDGGPIDPTYTWDSSPTSGMYVAAGSGVFITVSGADEFGTLTGVGSWSPNGFWIDGGSFPSGGTEFGMQKSGDDLEFQINAGSFVKFLGNVAASETNLEVNVDGTAETAQITIGADDSGGTGFRVLLVPNAV